MQYRMNFVLVALAAVALLVGTAGVAQADLIAHWTLDETSGATAFDETPNSHDGAVQGGTTMGVSGKINYAYSFDGTDGGAIVPDADDLEGMTNLTLTAWVNIPGFGATDAYRTVMAKGGTWSLQVTDRGEGDRTLDGNLYNGGWRTVKFDVEDAITDGWFSLNKWQHLAFVFEPAADGQELRLYVNGVKRAIDTTTVTSAGTYDSEVGLGVAWKGTSSYWLGGLDDLRVYNEALSDADIRAMGIPEPSTLLLLTTGLLGLLAYAWRKRK